MQASRAFAQAKAIYRTRHPPTLSRTQRAILYGVPLHQSSELISSRRSRKCASDLRKDHIGRLGGNRCAEILRLNHWQAVQVQTAILFLQKWIGSWYQFRDQTCLRFMLRVNCTLRSGSRTSGSVEWYELFGFYLHHFFHDWLFLSTTQLGLCRFNFSADRRTTSEDFATDTEVYFRTATQPRGYGNDALVFHLVQRAMGGISVSARIHLRRRSADFID